jgi:hypothetical protein
MACGVYNDRGMLYDVLQAGRKIENAHREGPAGEDRLIQPNVLLTDGTWVWPGALLHYVAVHHVALPRQFLQYAESRQWKIDALSIDLDNLNWDAFDAIPVMSEEAT